MKSSAVLINKEDNVATATKNLSAGEKLLVQADDSTFEVEVKEPVIFGHKFALSDISRGGHIIKYGEVIGVATRDISRYGHVHVHNVDSIRGTFTDRKEGQS